MRKTNDCWVEILTFADDAAAQIANYDKWQAIKVWKIQFVWPVNWTGRRFSLNERATKHILIVVVAVAVRVNVERTQTKSWLIQLTRFYRGI